MTQVDWADFILDFAVVNQREVRTVAESPCDVGATNECSETAPKLHRLAELAARLQIQVREKDFEIEKLTLLVTQHQSRIAELEADHASALRTVTLLNDRVADAEKKCGLAEVRAAAAEVARGSEIKGSRNSTDRLAEVRLEIAQLRSLVKDHGYPGTVSASEDPTVCSWPHATLKAGDEADESASTSAGSNVPSRSGSPSCWSRSRLRWDSPQRSRYMEGTEASSAAKVHQPSCNMQQWSVAASAKAAVASGPAHALDSFSSARPCSPLRALAESETSPVLHYRAIEPCFAARSCIHTQSSSLSLPCEPLSPRRVTRTVASPLPAKTPFAANAGVPATSVLQCRKDRVSSATF